MDGFPYPAAVRLLTVAQVHWRAIDGESARKGFDPLDYPLTRFLHLVLDWAREHTDPEQWDEVEAEIFAPIIGRDPDTVSVDVVDEEMSLFANFSRQNRALGG